MLYFDLRILQGPRWRFIFQEGYKFFYKWDIVTNNRQKVRNRMRRTKHTIFVMMILLITAQTAFGQGLGPADTSRTNWYYELRIGEDYKTGYTPSYGCFFNTSVKKIALPSSLQAGTWNAGYYTRAGGGPDTGGYCESHDVLRGPGKSIDCHVYNNGSPCGYISCIHPFYVNGGYNTIPLDRPQVYDFKVRFYVSMECEGSVDTGLTSFHWESFPWIGVGAADSALTDSTPVSPVTQNRWYTITNKKLTAYTEFELDAGKYVILSAPAGRYSWTHPIQGGTVTEYVDVNGTKLRIWYALDDRGPEVPETGRLETGDGSVYDETDDKYYTREDSAVEGGGAGGVTVKWRAVNDRGATVQGSSGESESGMAGYRVYELIDGTASEPPLAEIADETTVAGEELDCVVALGEGYHELVVVAYDKRGFESRYTYNEDGTRDESVAAAYSPALRVVVDRSGPGTVSGVGLGGGGNRMGLTGVLEWGAVTDPEEWASGVTLYEVELSGPGGVVTYEEEDTGLTLGGTGSGVYEARVRGVDLVGNYGEWSSAYVFYIDTEAPGMPAATAFGTDDPAAPVEVTGGEVEIHTTREDAAVTFPCATDGSEAWQSGVAGYEVSESVNGNPAVRVGAARISESGGEVSVLSDWFESGDSVEYTIRAVDAVGNLSDERVVRLVITELSGAWFGVPCYRYEDTDEDGEPDTYVVEWEEPEHIPDGAVIAYYRAVVRLTTEPRPGGAEAEALERLSERKLAVAEELEGEDVSLYVWTTDSLGNESLGVKSFHLPPVVIDPGEPYVLEEDEYWWSGVRELHTDVVVPEGVTLYVLSGTEVVAYGDVGLRVEGRLEVTGNGTEPVIFRSEGSGYHEWQGIMVTGEAEITHALIRDALRGVTAGSGSEVTVTMSVFEHNRAGLHAYGSSPEVTDCGFMDNEWYGVKEDGAGVQPVMTGCVFSGNGYDYYHRTERDLSMDELNAVSGNNGNRRE